MEALSWALYAVAAAAAAVLVIYLYRARETRVRGWGVVAALRWLALALVLLLLFDPRLPATGRRAGELVLLDASLSMTLPVAPGGEESRWQRAVEDARGRAGRQPVLLFGAAPRTLPAGDLGAASPADPQSRLLPALQAAAEAGVGRVHIISDGGIEDRAEVERWLPRLGLSVEADPVAREPLPNRALAELEAPAWVEAGDTAEVRVGVVATPGTGDSAAVLLRRADTVLARTRVALPAPGRVTPVTLRFVPAPPAPGAGGLVRYEVALAEPDVVPADDERTFYLNVGEPPGGVVIVSFRPDQEPRFLGPVLEQALGLPFRGFLRAGGDRWLRLGGGTEAATAVPEAQVRDALAAAELPVLHGLDASAPGWARSVAATAPRVLLFPGVGAAEVPVRLPPVQPGDWYILPAIPPSPVAPYLAGLQAEALPPLAGLRPAELPEGAWAPLLAGRGAGYPVAVGGGTDARRWVVATGVGYWRWAFRGGEPREAYRRLWSALGGWLLRERGPTAAGAARPAERAVPRGAPVRWLLESEDADSLAVRILAGDSIVADTALGVAPGDTAATAPLAPGHYRYEARVFADGADAGTATGPFTVASYSPEFMRPLQPLDDVEGDGGALGGEATGRRLHTTPWPYLLILLLLAAEWVLRRRAGLR